MYEKALRKAREQRKKLDAEIAADPAFAKINELLTKIESVPRDGSVDKTESIENAPADIAIPAIEVTPVIAASTPAPKRHRRSRVRRILLLPVKIAIAVVFIVGVGGGGMLLATVKGGDLDVRDYVEAVQDLPAMIVSKPCNFDHVNGTGCKS